MNHGKSNYKFHRETKQRSALMRSLAVALVDNSKIQTTQTKAKSLKTFIEKLVTRSKINNLTNIRYLSSELGTKPAMKLIKEIGPKFSEKNGGYTRIIKLPPRISDGSGMAIIEFIK